MVFYRTTVDTPFIAALRKDYTTPKDASVWTGNAPHGESAVGFLDAKGNGILLLSRDPEGYTTWSKALAKANLLKGKAARAAWAAMPSGAGCPEEWEIWEEDGVDVSGDRFYIRTGSSLF
jgi:hypothetical protein